MIIKTPNWYKYHTNWTDEQIKNHIKRKWTRRACYGLAGIIIAGSAITAAWKPIKEITNFILEDDSRSQESYLYRIYKGNDDEVVTWDHDEHSFVPKRREGYDSWGRRVTREPY